MKKYRMTWSIFSLMLIALVSFMISCTKEGPMGPQGPAGKDGKMVLMERTEKMLLSPVANAIIPLPLQKKPLSLSFQSIIMVKPHSKKQEMQPVHHAMNLKDSSMSLKTTFLQLLH
jgi:hypothetical protein